MEKSGGKGERETIGPHSSLDLWGFRGQQAFPTRMLSSYEVSASPSSLCREPESSDIVGRRHQEVPGVPLDGLVPEGFIRWLGGLLLPFCLFTLEHMAKNIAAAAHSTTAADTATCTRDIGRDQHQAGEFLGVFHHAALSPSAVPLPRPLRIMGMEHGRGSPSASQAPLTPRSPLFSPFPSPDSNLVHPKPGNDLPTSPNGAPLPGADAT